MAPATRVLCICRKCVTFQCINPATGIPQLGQLVTVKTRKSHLIKSEQHSVWVCGADKQGPSTDFDPSKFVQHELQSHADQAPDNVIPPLIGLSLDSEPPSLIGPSLDPSPLLVGPSSELDPPQDPSLESDPPQDYNCGKCVNQTALIGTSTNVLDNSLLLPAHFHASDKSHNNLYQSQNRPVLCHRNDLNLHVQLHAQDGRRCDCPRHMLISPPS
ncbi:hypothetical protein KEM48_013006 [Puccinia striiformis f. sp. tritici PST-130]|nr:hypothetical protein KEM48_013006 [Puccinia striiformis f. sp. tritici PST-130]